jgi:septal ring factor EnvC (AmiA/AmiB activator)
MEQINLNRPELWPQPTPFAARTMALVLGLVLAAVVAAYAYQGYRAAHQENALAAAEQERQRVRGELQGVEQAHAERRRALEALRGELSDLRQRVATFKRAERALTRRLQAAGSKGELVRALGRARAEQDGVWLTAFRLEGVSPVRLDLEGRALRPEAIPRYLQAVADEEPYRGGFFRDLLANASKGDRAGAGNDHLSFETRAEFPVVAEGGS